MTPVSWLSRLPGRGLVLSALLLLALAPGLGGCTEDKEQALEDAPAAATGVEAGEADSGSAAEEGGESAGNAGGNAAENTAGDAAPGASGTSADGSGDGSEDDSGADSGEGTEGRSDDGSEDAAKQNADNELTDEPTEEPTNELTDELTEEERLEVAKSLWPPVKSLVTSPFGERRAAITPILSDAPPKARFRGRSHSGLDLRGHLGWPVKSLGDGTVVSAGPGGNAGLMVKIRQADGKTVSYAHLGEALVKGGEKVSKGQHIGEVGCTGRTTGAHLHLSVRDEQGTLLDPEKEIEGLWEIYDPPLADLREPINAQSCGRRPGGTNPRLRGQQQYLRMRKALLENEYKIPDAIPSWESHDQ